MYIQNDDTLLLLESIKRYTGLSVLEIGVGSGRICEKLSENFEFVVGIDVDIESIKYCQKNIDSQNRKSQINWLCCDVVSSIVGKFDLIVSNPPYLPNEDAYDVQDQTVYGGTNGVELTIRFINESLPLLNKHGKIIIISSSLANINYLNEYISNKNLEKKIINKKKLLFYTIYLY
jgi:release factor glutamine methyltransferase